MDEPFAALDPQIRRSLQLEFRLWLDHLGAMDIRGRLDQLGTSLEVLSVRTGEPSGAGIARPERPLKLLPVTAIDVHRLPLTPQLTTPPTVPFHTYI